MTTTAKKSKAAVRSRAKTAAKRPAKTAAKRPAKTAAKPAAKTAAKPAAKTAAKPAAKGPSKKTADSMSIIVTKGSLDWGYPPFILATTAASMGLKVSMFFTFYGLQLLKKKLDHLKVSTLGNPAMEMPMMGMQLQMPNMVSMLPGVDAMASTMMRDLMKKKGVASLEELREAAVDLECRLIACQMTVDLFELKPEDMMEGLEYAGAATYIETASQSDINLFI